MSEVTRILSAIEGGDPSDTDCPFSKPADVHTDPPSFWGDVLALSNKGKD